MMIRRAIEDKAYVLEHKAREKELQLQLEDGTDLEAIVYVDRKAWSRVLMSPFLNATKVMKEECITVSISSFEMNVEGTMKDRDIGPVFLERILVAFDQESAGRGPTHEGTGIGLTIDKHLVELMKGSIGGRSKKKRGTQPSLFDCLDVRPVFERAGLKILSPAPFCSGYVI